MKDIKKPGIFIFNCDNYYSNNNDIDGKLHLVKKYIVGYSEIQNDEESLEFYSFLIKTVGGNIFTINFHPYGIHKNEKSELTKRRCEKEYKKFLKECIK